MATDVLTRVPPATRRRSDIGFALRLLTPRGVSRAVITAIALMSSTGIIVASAREWSVANASLVIVGPWVLVVVVHTRWLASHFGSLVAPYLVFVTGCSASVVLLVTDPALGPVGAALALSLAAGVALVIASRHTVDRWLILALPDESRSLLADVTRRCRWQRFAPGAVVLAEGDRSDSFYVVSAGAAEATQVTNDDEIYVHTYQPGQFFGEVGLLHSVPRTATVRAVSTLELVVLDDAAFEHLVGESSSGTLLAETAMARAERAPARMDAVPLPSWTRLTRRILKHPAAMHYNRLIALVVTTNAIIAAYAWTRAGWWSSDGTDLSSIAIVAQANFALAIVFRQQYVINALAWLATRPPTTWPLRLRWMLGKYYHFGGLHVGAAIAGTLWYIVLVASLTHDLVNDVGDASVASTVVAYMVVTLFVVMVVMASPGLRAAQHDRFEVTHRFCGWAAVVLVWISTVLFVESQRGDESLPSSLLRAPTVWILVATTICAVWPWLLLRRVPITANHPSSHAVIIELDHGVTPGIGTTRPISRHPLVGWHHFANVPPPPGSTGYRMVISRAGDWTSEFVDEPPASVWVRGIPTMGVANVRKLFSKVVLVATGSGIGPMLGHLLDTSVPSRLVWVTKNPRATYGDQLIDEIEAAQPDAIIWDTDDRGKPDVLRLAYGAYLSSDAEAVVCIANRTVTWNVVNGLERRGIPAFGPIWDS